MALIERKAKDIMRGREYEITIRFDDEDVIKLPCHYRYDLLLSSIQDGNQVILPKKVEVKKEDGSWVPYPSVTWLDGVEFADQLLTNTIVMRTGGKEISILSSHNRVPDGKLIYEAGKAGIYAEFITGQVR